MTSSEGDLMPSDANRLAMLRRKTWRIVGAIAIIAGGLPLGQLAFDIASSLWAGRQPQADVRKLSGMQTDVLLQHITDELGAPPTTIYSRFAAVDPVSGSQVELRDFMYVLDTVYVEVFVDNTDLVRAYAVTLRENESVTVPVSTYSDVVLGETAFGDLFPFSEYTYSACGTHTFFYYELSNTSNADTGGRRLAVGVNAAGYIMPSAATSICASLVPPANTTSTFGPSSGLELNSYFGTHESLEQLQNFSTDEANSAARTTTPVNSVIVSSPTWDIEVPMMDLHPDSLPR